MNIKRIDKQIDQLQVVLIDNCNTKHKIINKYVNKRVKKPVSK